MELKDFVSQALTEIADGVRDAQLAMQDSGALVNPSLHNVFTGNEKNSSILGWSSQRSGTPVLLVSFDVAVTTTEGTKTKGGIGVVTGFVTLGSTGASDKGQSAATRIAFQVPLQLPAHSTPPKSAA